jgi:hypothetical protein
MRSNLQSPVRRGLVIALAAVLAACGGSGAGTQASSAPSISSAAPPAAPSAVASEMPLPADIPTATLEVVAGEVVATGEVTPEDGGLVTATTADGVIYTLAVEPDSVLEPITIELRPLAGMTELGPVLAGADFAPAGLRLLRPATLTVEGLDVPPTVAAFAYRGDPSGADARLAIGPLVEDGLLAFSVSHFSGNVAVNVGNGANQLFDKWSTARGDDTPTGRQAAAETRYAAAELAERTGHISSDTAQDIQSRAMSEWMTAESDRLAQNPELARLAEAGDPRDLDTLGAELDRILAIEHERQILGDEAGNDALAKVMQTVAAYEAAITSRIVDSKRIQDASKSGRLSDVEEIMDLLVVIAGLERSIQLLAGPESAALAKVFDLIANLRTGLLESCKEAPLDPAIVLGFERVVQLLGGAGAIDLADVMDCVWDPHTPQPAAGERAIDGTITYDATVGSGSLVDTYHVVVDARIREEPGGGSLAFASGSTLTVDWTGPSSSEVFNCPTSGRWKTSVGTPSGEGWSRLSDPNPGAIGIVLEGGAEMRVDIQFNGIPLSENCSGAGVALRCPLNGGLIGKLVGTRPKDWSFSCSGDTPDWFVSVGGHFVQVRG